MFQNLILKPKNINVFNMMKNHLIDLQNLDLKIVLLLVQLKIIFFVMIVKKIIIWIGKRSLVLKQIQILIC